MWHPSKSKPDLSILGLVLYDHYGPPDSLNLGDGAEPVNDDSTLDEYNIKEFVDRFVHAAVKYAESSITTNVLFPMGEDFCYRNSEPYYKNMDKIIHYMKKDGRVNAFYSNPEIYVDAVKKETKASKHEWLQNNDDFFPYSHNPHSYWTGYFTSRPAVKRLERQAMNVLMACRQAEIFTSSKDEFKQSKSSSSLRLARAMAIVQHHDGVSGTEKQFVAEDYTKRLSQGVKKCEDVISRAYFCSNDQFPVETARNNEMEGRESDPALLETCLQATNTSICAGTERAIAGAEISVVVYNPLGFIPGAAETAVERTQKLFNLKDSQKCRTQEVRLPVIANSQFVHSITHFATGSATHEVVFDACVRPLAFSRYLIKLQNSSEPGGQNDDAANLCNTPFRVSNGIVTVEFENMKIKMSCTLGVITHIAGEDGEDIKLQQEFMYYESNNGSAEVNSPSGAYIFRPVSQTPEPIEPSNELKIVEGSRTRNGHLLEVRVHINPWLSQIIRPAASTNEKMLDVSVVVGPIPVAPSITESSASATQEMSPQAASPWVGKEVIVRYTTDIKSKGVFYTDANGREMQRRVRDHRENWPLRDTEPVSRNYYPINTRLSIRDEQMDSASKLIKTLNLYTDRSVGGSSISDGQIELMIHRRCLHDDYLGVGDPLDEPGYVSYPGWKQTSDCKADGVREPENDKDVTSILSSDISGFCACDETHKVKFDCGHESTSCADACPSSPKCRFRRTGGCDPHGPREPAGDTDCDATIIHGMSGFCECDGDYTVPFTCDHGPIKCKDVSNKEKADAAIDLYPVEAHQLG
ncbi:hypothetical protein SARC_05918 [Sphaeroforma arctica JP610]|uniref:Alpha-mannosidase n=1 Tax=Sphaeroforma arctica JP610 TaxID=667725 RepID=A0A0L0FY58_9EUKA|nr:hypothetical protein SARC_05918 [Sphaeroforma arctica JP610]KNC81770.1 hypothetical protein SARC_05918 [Sphaeroforma arctica JP610]|eukprot:XP_014155672.1 hypothetical protein SARC_05918 [Sphaeroforma arctica JP610]